MIAYNEERPHDATCEAAGVSDAWVQEVRECGGDDQRDRVDTQDQKGAI